MKDLWNQRYNTDEYVYGREANAFFVSSLEALKPGKILLPGEGEGRNAVFAAGQGWKVDAFDQSSVGAEKTERFAREKGVQINYKACELEDYPFEEGIYDVIGLVYFHAPTPVRKLLHQKVLEALSLN